MNRLARWDREYVWHPFTQMREWMRSEPVVIVSGRGAILRDSRGREYLDANSSIWTNLHGHRHPALDAAIRGQLNKVAHTSALGLANEPASVLAARLVRLANPRSLTSRKRIGSGGIPSRLSRVFFSDDGSTALEVALKLAWEFTRRTRGDRRPRFLSLEGAYHGDTIGAVSLGHIDRFHAAFRGLLLGSDSVMAPYCYRCRFNRAAPERADARSCRVCNWECVSLVEKAFESARRRRRPYAAFVFEPRIQGAAGMIPHPEGWLGRVAAAARAQGVLLIADEVLSGFGRTGAGPASRRSLFASHQEGVQPDFLNLAKGLSGGYLPIAATLTTQAVFNAFLGEYDEFRTFFHGHSYTANPLGAAAAVASLDLLEDRSGIHHRRELEDWIRDELASLWSLPAVGDLRQVGLVVGIELVRDWRTREPFHFKERIGSRVCDAMRRRGVLTRPVGDVIVLMPPYCTTRAQWRRMVAALADSIEEICGAVLLHSSTPGNRRRRTR